MWGVTPNDQGTTVHLQLQLHVILLKSHKHEEHIGEEAVVLRDDPRVGYGTDIVIDTCAMWTRGRTMDVAYLHLTLSESEDLGSRGTRLRSPVRRRVPSVHPSSE